MLFVLINKICKDRKITVYKLSKGTHIPYSTLKDLLKNRKNLSKTSFSNVVKISKYLNITLSDIEYDLHRPQFTTFRSEMCHRLKRLGDQNFINYVIHDQLIETFYKMKWYPEMLYTLAILDKVSKENKITLNSKYNSLRTLKLKEMILPEWCYYIDYKIDSLIENADKDFLKYNIVEGDIRDVA
ncbi:hypothetical protein B7939_02115 [Eggerthia catenaformis]|nr:hypothetical protein B7939_02115 [Eggerthia catenaformis]